MSVTLSSADLSQLARAVQLLISPLDHDHVDGWRSEVNRCLRELLHADSAGFLLPVEDALMLPSEEHDPAEPAAHPAFRAGVENYLRWHRQREDLLHALDGLGQAAMVFSLEGRVLHRTPALQRMLAAEREPELLRAALQTSACDLGRLVLDRDQMEAPAPLREDIRTSTATYRVSTCLYGRNADPLILVGLERRSSTLPSAEALRERFGLTPRQAQVALLLAGRLSNKEIADRLSISPHTVLRHTEAVLRKLRVDDRRRVADRLRD